MSDWPRCKECGKRLCPSGNGEWECIEDHAILERQRNEGCGQVGQLEPIVNALPIGASLDEEEANCSLETIRRAQRLLDAADYRPVVHCKTCLQPAVVCEIRPGDDHAYHCRNGCFELIFRDGEEISSPRHVEAQLQRVAFIVSGRFQEAMNEFMAFGVATFEIA